jgi:outer membrane protein OmpA-like peptidoglycan-associated protein
MKRVFSLLTLLILSLVTFAQSGNYSVQVGAFNAKVDNDYFKKMDGVTYYKDHNDIHRYYIMGLTSKNEAEMKADAARKLGFRAVVIDNDDVTKNCKITCGVASKTPEPEISALNWIFFDFDKADLRAAAKSQLDKLQSVLTANPTYTAELSAHTDAKGSNEYNQALSERRANNSKNYVTGKGIAAARIKTSTNGEAAPIAKNELSAGKDTEAGRQYNRRVEIRVFDAAGKQLNVVEAPNVPSTLKQ